MQFLQQLNRNGETGVQKIKEFMQGNIVSIVTISACAFFVLGCWLLYTANRTANDNYHVTNTVQSIKDDNQQARKQVRDAANEVKHAEKQLNRSIKRTDEVSGRIGQTQKRIDENSKVIDDCERIITEGERDTAEARSIFADIDRRNKTDGTQTNDNA